LLDTTPKTIATLVNSGVLTRLAHGKFDLVEAVRAALRHARDRSGSTVAASVGSERAPVLKLQGDRLALALATELFPH
jgi:hypothetical protein